MHIHEFTPASLGDRRGGVAGGGETGNIHENKLTARHMQETTTPPTTGVRNS